MSTSYVVLGHNRAITQREGWRLYYRRIRDLREDADLTQDKLVQKLGMHKTTYTNYEQGKREPPFSFIIQLADFYGVSIDYIAGRSDSPNK